MALVKNLSWIRPIHSAALRWGMLLVTMIAYWLVCFEPYHWNAPLRYVVNDARFVSDGAEESVLAFRGSGRAEFLTSSAESDWLQPPTRVQLLLKLRCDHQGQTGPARIVSLSRNTQQRNLLVGQEGSALVIRLLRPDSDMNGLPEYRIANYFAVCDWRELSLLLDAGSLRLESDGQELLSVAAPEAALSRWASRYPLNLGNEGTWDRGWSGKIADIAFEVDGKRLIDGLQDGTVAPGAWLLSRRAQGTHRFTLVPFSDTYRLAWLDQTRNVLGFLPFGFLLALGWGRRLNVFTAALLSMLFSLSIELGQIGFEGRVPSSSDLVTNTAGGILGFLFGMFLLRKNLEHASRGDE